jgi:DNA (cytosine-5)-methyltransferase 1
MKSGPKEDDPLMLQLIQKAFQEIGYETTYQVLEATDFGVPQKRKRLLLIGWDTSKFPRFDPTSFWASVSSWGTQQTVPLLRSFVISSMEGSYEMKSEEVPEEFDAYAIETSEPVSGTPHPFVKLKAGEKLLSCSKRVSPVHSEVVDLDKPSKTIICTYDHQPRLLVGLKTSDGKRYVRTYLPLELKQVQGFPADYVVLGNQKEQVVQIGNAVPPALVQGVSHILRSYLEPVIEETVVPVQPKRKTNRKN